MDNQDHYSEIIINFAGDEEILRKFLEYTHEKRIFNDKIKIKIEKDSIFIQFSNTFNYDIEKEKIKNMLAKYLNEFCNTREIIEFRNLLVVGIRKHLTEISNFVQCEICGFPVNTEEELLVHRRIHGII